MKKTYRTIVHYEGAVTLYIEADSREKAKQYAEALFDDMSDKDIVANLYEIGVDDVYEVKQAIATSRVDKIVSFAAKKELEKLEKEAEKANMIEYTKGLIRALKPRIDELLEVGNACLEHNIPLEGKAWGGHEGYDTNQFITNSWSHLLGFVAHRNPSNGNKVVFKQLGIMGGGACNYNLKTDGKTIEVDGDVLWVLKHFVEKFDEFETEFYNYVDSVIEGK